MNTLNNYNKCVCVQSCVQLFVTLWAVTCQAPLSMGFFQARILEWAAISSSRRSSWSRDQIQISCVSCIIAVFLTGVFLTAEPLICTHETTTLDKNENTAST